MIIKTPTIISSHTGHAVNECGALVCCDGALGLIHRDELLHE
jgi:hypothetical protein